MRSNPRIFLILGLDGDAESGFVQTLVEEADTLLLETPFDTSAESDVYLEKARSYFAGAPAVQPLPLAGPGALQRAVDGIAARYGRLDNLILGSRACFDGFHDGSPWQRFTQPYRFDRLAPIVACLPLLTSASAPGIIELQPYGSDRDEHADSGLFALLSGTPILYERVQLAPAPARLGGEGEEGDASCLRTLARGMKRATTL
ncbi:hypothetical protein [Salinicola peritrichatus]|uniref:hypothetical protein n=1 Tax=Salinicola peritrichatus TaxID=1267424 RepID=UPI000DA1FA0F|nr:hypothetical protein [Salinicola peritrichatus]